MMSAAPGSDVLRDLLHSVCQPLTTLHCALESSLSPEQSGHVADVALALEQTDRVIETVRLMREYLEVEQGCSSVALVPVGSAVDVPIL